MLGDILLLFCYVLLHPRDLVIERPLVVLVQHTRRLLRLRHLGSHLFQEVLKVKGVQLLLVRLRDMLQWRFGRISEHYGARPPCQEGDHHEVHTNTGQVLCPRYSERMAAKDALIVRGQRRQSELSCDVLK